MQNNKFEAVLISSIDNETEIMNHEKLSLTEGKIKYQLQVHNEQSCSTLALHNVHYHIGGWDTFVKNF